MTARRVLVTGGLGFLGSNLTAACAARGDAVTIVDNLHAGAGGNRANIRGLDARVIDGDVRDSDLMAACVRDAEVVFHCAALTSHAGSMTDPIETAAVNAGGTLTLLEAARRANPAVRIVHVGTSTQIGKMRASPIDEAHGEFPLDVYSATKTAAEKYVLVYASAHGLRASVVRLSNVYGPRAHVRTARFGFINFFVGLGLQGKTITVFGEGAQLRSATHVDDAVAALMLAAGSDAARGEVCFAVADERYSVADIAAAVASVIGGRVEHVPWPPGREQLEVGDAVISAAKIESLLGWRATRELRAGLADTNAYYRAHLEDYL